MSERDSLLERLDAVESRLAALAATPTSPTALTDADPGTGERWDSGQVWAHLAEFVPYWVDQCRGVVSTYKDEPVPFGRTKTDATRIAAIERDRSVSVAVLWSQTLSDIEAARRYIGSLDDAGLSARGLHPTMGVMTAGGILDEFVASHLEQHAAQLERLR